MAYDESQDKLVEQFTLTAEDESELLVSIMKYGSSDPKVQITRMFKKRDGTVGYGKMGRLTKEEVEFLKENVDKILELM